MVRRILSSIDLGTNSIKLIVAEIINDKINILCAISEISKGLKDGLITNDEDVIYSIKKILKKGEDILGLKIKKVVTCVPEYSLKFIESVGVNTITNEDGVVTKSDISRLLKTCAYNKIEDDYELINIIPLEYKLDDKTIKNPIGMMGSSLKLNSLIISAPKESPLVSAKFPKSLHQKSTPKW